MKAALISTVLVLGLIGAAHAEQRTLTGFTRVSAQAGTQVEVAIGPNFRVEVTGPDAARIETYVRGDRLIVRPVRDGRRGRRDAHVQVTLPSVEGLEASSGAHLNARGLAASDISLDASSGADLRAAGACRAVNADASSGANLDAAQLHCDRGAVDVSSGARVAVNVSGRLDVDASSGGDLYASGTPEIGDISLSSGGALHRR